MRKLAAVNLTERLKLSERGRRPKHVIVSQKKVFETILAAWVVAAILGIVAVCLPVNETAAPKKTSQI